MQFNGRSVPYVLRAVLQAAGLPSADIDLLIVCTHNFCDSEDSCLHGPNANSKSDQSTNLHHQERRHTLPTPKMCRHTMYTTPALRRKSRPVKKIITPGYRNVMTKKTA